MSGCGKGGKAKGKCKARSSHDGLQFTLGYIHHHLHKRNNAERIGDGAHVNLTALMEYLATKVLKMAGNAAHVNEKLRVIPRHLQ